MSNNNLQIELQEAQQKKIEFFCQFINIIIFHRLNII
jgi:hypothetical protein